MRKEFFCFLGQAIFSFAFKYYFLLVFAFDFLLFFTRSLVSLTPSLFSFLWVVWVDRSLSKRPKSKI